MGKRKGYEKLIRLDLEFVLPKIKAPERGQKRKDGPTMMVGNHVVKCHSVRLRTFKRSIVCVGCGMVGAHFWVERNGGKTYHLNMYGFDKFGKETLMTRDHIIPKSKGGPNSLKNMQTMCCRCNCKKADKMPSAV